MHPSRPSFTDTSSRKPSPIPLPSGALVLLSSGPSSTPTTSPTPGDSASGLLLPCFPLQQKGASNASHRKKMQQKSPQVVLSMEQLFRIRLQITMVGTLIGTLIRVQTPALPLTSCLNLDLFPLCPSISSSAQGGNRTILPHGSCDT